MITRTTYRRPLPGSPLFFCIYLHLCAQQQQNSTALKPSLPCVVQNSRPISSHFSACISPLFVFVLLFLCSSAIRLVRVRVPFARDFRPRSSKHGVLCLET